MEITVVEESKKRIVCEIPGEGHTLCNALKSQLLKNEHVKIATYSIKHPLLGTPVMLIDTDGTISPREAMAEAANALSDECKEFRKEFDRVAK